MSGELARVMPRVLVVIGAGLGATYVMGLATTAVATLQSERDRRQERDASPGVAYEVAARRTAGLLGRDLTDRQTSAAHRERRSGGIDQPALGVPEEVAAAGDWPWDSSPSVGALRAAGILTAKAGRQL